MTKEIVVKTFTKEISAPIAEAQALEITSPAQMTEGVQYLSQLNKFLDRVVEYKKSKTDPINKALKIIRAETKPIEEALEGSISVVRQKMSSYQTEQKRITDEAAERIAARVRAGTGNLTPETAIKKLEALDTPEKVVSADSGSVQFRTKHRVEILDIKALPAEYLIADEAKILQAQKEGIDLAGVRYYTTQEPYNTR